MKKNKIPLFVKIHLHNKLSLMNLTKLEKKLFNTTILYVLTLPRLFVSMAPLVLTTNHEQAIRPAYSFTSKEVVGVMAVTIFSQLLTAIKGPNTFGLVVPIHFSRLPRILTRFYPSIPIITSETGKKSF